MYEPRDVILCSSFSKTLCPGYRIGWIMLDRIGRRPVNRDGD